MMAFARMVEDKAAKSESASETGDALADINHDLGSLAKNVSASLVRVQAGRRGAGAGVVVHDQGLIITNAHVAQGRRLKVVDWQGRELTARLHSWQRNRDLAVLTLADADLPALEIGNSKDLQPGSWVLAMGHPFGVSGGATAGVVIGVGSRLPEVPRGGEDWLAMSLHLRPGHSGGPVVNAAGQLVGLNTRMAGPEVGLAIPSHLISTFLKESFSKSEPHSPVQISRHWL